MNNFCVLILTVWTSSTKDTAVMSRRVQCCSN